MQLKLLTKTAPSVLKHTNKDVKNESPSARTFHNLESVVSSLNLNDVLHRIISQFHFKKKIH